jgi:hypothetical protein
VEERQRLPAIHARRARERALGSLGGAAAAAPGGGGEDREGGDESLHGDLQWSCPIYTERHRPVP